MKTSFKLFYYYFVINDVWINIVFQIDENIIYEYTRGYPNGITKKFNKSIILFMKIKMLSIVI